MFKSLIKLVVLVFCLASISTVAFAKDGGEKKARGDKAAKGDKAEPAKQGTIVAITGDTIEFSIPAKKTATKKGDGADTVNKAPDAPAESLTLKLGPDTRIAAIKTLKLSELTGEKWATVAGTVSDDQTSIEAKMINLAPEAPKQAKPAIGKGRATGMLSVKDGQATLKSGDKTIAVTTTEKTAIQGLTPIESKDLKVGAMVQLSTRASKTGEQTLAQITVQPPRPEKKGQAGKGKGDNKAGQDKKAGKGGKGKKKDGAV